MKHKFYSILFCQYEISFYDRIKRHYLKLRMNDADDDDGGGGGRDDDDDERWRWDRRNKPESDGDWEGSVRLIDI